ncbi:MAG: immunoglobulin domain-containing protein [Verrucomicrobiae bacterium]|nr:immunoglobulin domain-containing protein [Verrucomicrobiae bacterium]
MGGNYPMVHALAVQADGSVLMGGWFPTIGEAVRANLARLHADGTLDPVFNPGANEIVHCFVVQGDGRIVVGGAFSQLAGYARHAVARLNVDGTLDFWFNPLVGGPGSAVCSALVEQPDGKLVVGGLFTSLGGQPHSNLGRLEADGTVDASFAADTDGVVVSLTFAPDGKILVGGDFRVVAGQPRTNLARLNADGTLDSEFNPGANRPVQALAIQADGKILVGGSFTTLGGQPRSGIARLNEDGSLDGGFSPGVGGISPYSYVYSLAVQADGKILLGGYFTSVAGQSRNYLARLNANGTLDSGFNPGANGVVNALAIQADGKVLVGGEFTSLDSGSRYSLGRLYATTAATQSLSFDSTTVTWLRGGTSPEVGRTSFDHSPDGVVWTDLGEGTRIAGGWQLNGVAIPLTGRLRARGWVSGGYGSGSGWFLEAYAGEPVIVAEPVGRTNDAETLATFSVLVKGSEPFSFQWFKDGVPVVEGGNVTGTTSATLTLTNVLGGDTGDYQVVASNSFGSVTSVVASLTVRDPVILAQPASQARELGEGVNFGITVNGTAPLAYQWWKNDAPLSGANEAFLAFTNLQASDAGTYRVEVSNVWGSVSSDSAWLTVNVITLETDFNPALNSTVFAQALQPDGKTLLGGDFTTVSGQARNRIARLNANGTLDTGFNPGANGSVFCLAVQADGKILLGGGLTSLAGQTRNHLARLHADGTLDNEFNPGADSDVTCLALLPDGKILVGGSFSTVGGQSHRHLALLNPDGTPDNGISLDANNVVASLAVQPDGQILVGGFFTTLNGQSRNRIGRFSHDGTLDFSFNPGANAGVTALALQADGKILVGGYFSRLGGQAHTNIARLNLDGTLDSDFSPHAGTIYENDYPAVYSLAVQVDGGILMGGSFSTMDGEQRYYLARLQADGRLDNNFNPAMSTAVYGLALQPDGEILVAGSVVLPNGQWRQNLLRLHNSNPATQSLGFDDAMINWLREGTGPEVWRTTFEHSPDGLDWEVLGEGVRVPGGWQLSEVSAPSGGTIRARGYVTGGQYNGSGWYVETTYGQPFFLDSPVSRTNDAGTTATFSVAAGGSEPLSFHWLKDEIPLNDGANVSGVATATLSLSNVLKASEGGYAVAVSSTFGSVTSAVAQFTVIDPVINAQPASQLGQLGQGVTFTVAATGTAPLQYQWWKDGAALDLAAGDSLTLTNLQAGDAGGYRVVVSNAYGTATSSVAFLSVNLATLDTTFPPAADRDVYALAVQPDGKILVGGAFTKLGDQIGTNLARLHPDGTLDNAFNPRPNSAVYALALQSDGKIVIGGAFTRVGGLSRTNLARLNPDGSLDAGFTAAVGAAARSVSMVSALAIQPDGKILVSGAFATLGGMARTNLARLNADGTVDAGFNPAPRGSGGATFLSLSEVRTLAVQPDGKILLGGTFTTLAGQPRSNLGRLNSDGSLDSPFNPGANSNVLALVLQADGRILVSGHFTSLGAQSRTNLARLHADGSLDASFNPGVAGGAGLFPRTDSRFCLAVQTDGTILLGGRFTTVAGQACTNLVRLEADGTLDNDFNPGAGGSSFSSVNSLVLQPDGKILVGGAFTWLAGLSQTNLGRLNTTAPATQSLSLDGSTITWLRDGTGPEVWRTTFESSSNGLNWTQLGSGQRGPGGWQLTNVAVQSDATIRARGFIPSSGVGGGIVETVVRLMPIILTSDGAFGIVSNQFGFHFAGLPGQVVVVESSTDLLQWWPLQTNTLGSSPLYFSELWSGLTPQRFYRVRPWP